MTNIVLNAPLPVLADKQAYENKVLFMFVIFMVFMVVFGLLFVSLGKEISSSTPSYSIEEESTPIQQGEYV